MADCLAVKDSPAEAAQTPKIKTSAKNGFSKFFSGFSKFDAKILIFWGLGGFTLLYGALSLIIFYFGLLNFSNDVIFFWRFSLVSYTVLKEVFHYKKIAVKRAFGELFTIFLIATYLWMELYNLLYRGWWLGAELFKIPEGYANSTIEASVLLTISLILWAFFRCDNNNCVENSGPEKK